MKVYAIHWLENDNNSISSGCVRVYETLEKAQKYLRDVKEEELHTMHDNGFIDDEIEIIDNIETNSRYFSLYCCGWSIEYSIEEREVL